MDKLTIYLVDTNKFDINNILSSSFLSKKDLDEVDKYKNEISKKEKAVSAILKNKFIGDYSLNEFGKPISKNKYFNVSHSHGVVVLIIDKVNIGIDIEKRRLVSENLKKYISNKDEIEYIKNDMNFFEIWTNKESLVKCLGTGVNTRVEDIPGLPINGVRNYLNKSYISKTLSLFENVISITRESIDSFDIEIKDITNSII